jgi:hypothetical protein
VKRRHSSSRLRWVLPAVLAVLACSGAQADTDTFPRDLGFFLRHLVAGDFEQAAVYVTPDAMESFAALHDPTRNVYRIEDFSVLSMAAVAGSKPMKMLALVSVEARREGSLTMRTLRLRQVWQWSGRSWRLVSEEMVGPPGPSGAGGRSGGEGLGTVTPAP